MIRSLALASLALIGSAAGQTSDWNQFRGPGGLSVADDTPIPVRFGPAENVLWKAQVPAGHSSPCIVGQRIFLTGFEDGHNLVFALDRGTGKELWRQSFKANGEHVYLHPDAKPAQPTVASDGEHVVAYFGSYGLVTLDLDGKLLWEKPLDYPQTVFGEGSSPLLFEGILILDRDGTSEAGILALDVTDGNELYRIDRFGYSKSFGTPFLWVNADRHELIIPGTNSLYSYDPGSGDELWHLKGLTDLPCTTPTADADTLYFAGWSTPNAEGRSFWEAGFTRSLEISDAEAEDPSLLFKRLDANSDGKVVPDEVPECRFKDAFGFVDRDGNGSWSVEELASPPAATSGKNLMVAVARGGKGDVSESHVRWSYRRGLPYVASPLLYRGRLWLFKSGGLVSALDPKSGKPSINRERLSDHGEYYLSPVGAAGHLIAGSAEGTLYVIDAEAEDLKIEHEVLFDEPLFGSPAVLEGKIYLRTTSTMWAFAQLAE